MRQEVTQRYFNKTGGNTESTDKIGGTLEA